MQHPVTDVFGVELDVAGLRDTYQDRILREPERLRLSSSLRSGHHELIAMKVNRVMVHAQVHDADANPLSLFHQHGCGVGTGPAIEGHPVEFHGHCIGHGVVRKDGPFLEQDPEVAVDFRGREFYERQTSSMPTISCNREVGWAKRKLPLLSVNSYTKRSPGWMGFCPRPTLPSMVMGTSKPCQ